MTLARPRPGTLVGMTAVEVIYLIAAILWIGAVLAALAIGTYVALRLRARRRRVTRLLGAVRDPAAWLGSYWRSSGPRVPTSMNEMTKIIVSSVKIASAESRSPHWKG